MINWLRTRLHNFIFPQDISITEGSSKLTVRANDGPDIEGMRFTVMPAEGGTIIQMRVYDRRKDESNNKTYVIPDSEQDVAHRVGQIVAMELIRL
jgi:hypothetical protein